MKTRVFICCFVLSLSFVVSFSQTEAEVRYAKERYEEKTEEIKAELISDIVTDLGLDAFEKEIVSQSINSYFEEIQKIYVLDLPVFEKKELVSQLDGRHFSDLKTILDQNQIDFILNQIKGDWKKNKKKSKRKKKRKN